MNRRRLLEARQRRTRRAPRVAGRLFAAPIERAALSAGVPARRLRLDQSAGSLFEQLLLRGAPEHRHRPARSGLEHRRARLDADWALAPAVRDTIGALYLQRQVAFMPFAGTDDLSRSHFETQDSIELGQPSSGARNYRSGFLGRLSDTLLGASASAIRPIAFTDALPLAFQGAATVPNLSLKNVGKPPFDERQAGILSDMYAGHHLEAAVRDGLELRQEVAQEMADEMSAANRGAINTKGFELEAERMGRLMRDKYRIGFIDVGGWDTHVGEGAAQGRSPATLAKSRTRPAGVLADARRRMEQHRGRRAVGIRPHLSRERQPRHRPRPRHACTGCSAARSTAARIAGEQQLRERATLFQDRDYPVLNDYRAVLGRLVSLAVGTVAGADARVFPQAAPLDLKLV